MVERRWGRAPRERHGLGEATALVELDADGGPRAWVLAGDTAERALGPAIVWADRYDVADLHVLALAPPVGPAGAAGVLARQAGEFVPAPSVWSVTPDGPTVAVAAPVPAQASAPAPAELVDLLIDAGLEIVAEGGIVRGEVNGLEVARIVSGETTAGVPIDAPQLEVGVGKADRELTALVHGELTPVAQLARVVEIVRAERRPGVPRHPLNQLVPERWLRAVLCRRPDLVGLAALRPAEGARPRPNLSERDVAVARGETAEGEPAVVACAIGIALDLVPAAADARLALDPGARLVLAVPARDDHPGVRRLAARLRVPADVVPVEGDWHAAG